VRPREKARCVRCRSILYRGIYSDASRMAAITLGAIFTFLIAQFFPIVELEVGGYNSSATLLGAIRVLWMEQMQARGGGGVPVHDRCCRRWNWARCCM
jgi:paraquat-inducible protein A